MIQETGSKQIRALILLLILVPLIPTAIMLRFMLNAAQAEKEDTHERLRSVYQQALFTAKLSFQNHAKNMEDGHKPNPREAFDFFNRAFDTDIQTRLCDQAGKPFPNGVSPAGELVASAPLGKTLPGWQAQLFLSKQAFHNSAMQEQSRIYGTTILTAILADLLIAGIAGYALLRNLRLNEMKSTSLATISHELKTPLAAMTVLIDTLRESRYRDPKQLPEYLDMIAQENIRLSRLVDNFLTLSRLDQNLYAFKPQPLDASELVRSVAEDFCALHKDAKQALHTEIEPGIRPLSADKDAFAMALANLLENSFKFTGPDKRIFLRASQEPGFAVFEVEDNGIGIPKSERERIFAPFHQIDEKLSRAREGCGLGLSIVKSIIEAHRGRIVVESEQEQGARIALKLPN